MLVRNYPRRWRRLLVATVAVAGAAAFAITTTGDDRTPPARPSGARVVPPGERLVPELAFVTLTPPTEEPRSELPIPYFEVLPDGSVARIPLDVPPHTAISGLRPTADGRWTAHGTRDLEPGVTYPEGPDNPGVGFPLMVFGTDGALESDRDIRVVGEYTTLLGATAAEATLLRWAEEDPRPARIAAHDLRSGTERLLTTTSLPVSAGDVEGGRVVVAGPREQHGDCLIETAGQRLSVPACQQVTDVNVTPDGRHAAVVYERHVEPMELRLRIMDLDTTAVYSDEPLEPRHPCLSCVVTAHGAGYLGTAWSDNTTLRIAQLDPLPLDFDPAHVLSDIADRVHTMIRPLPVDVA